MKKNNNNKVGSVLVVGAGIGIAGAAEVLGSPRPDAPQEDKTASADKPRIKEYRKLADGLEYKRPFSRCCDRIICDVYAVEPFEGRSFEVKRTCVMECEKCGKQHVFSWG